MPTATTAYRERLTVPWGWWIVAIALALTLSVAVLFSIGPWWALGVTLMVVGLTALLLYGYGSVRIEVGADGLRVGRSRIEWHFVEAVEPLDPERMRHRLGPGADPAAFLVVRPYVSAGVEITIADPEDPHPYWLVSSRHPDQLAQRARAAQLAAAGR